MSTNFVATQSFIQSNKNKNDTLNIKDQCLSLQDFEDLNNYLINYPNTIHYCNIESCMKGFTNADDTTKAFKILLKGLSNQTIIYFNCSFNAIGKLCGNEFCEFLSTQKELEYLNCYNIGCSIRLIDQMVSVFPESIKYLDLGSNCLKNNMNTTIDKEYDTSLSMLIQKCKYLEALSLSGTRISTQFDLVSESLIDKTNLCFLDISDCIISNSQIVKNCLINKPNLRWCNLWSSLSNINDEIENKYIISIIETFCINQAQLNYLNVCYINCSEENVKKLEALSSKIKLMEDEDEDDDENNFIKCSCIEKKYSSIYLQTQI